MSYRTKERGEGKVGCIISLIVMTIAVAAGMKVIPIYYSNNSLADMALRKAETAAGRDVADLTKELRDEARKLDITEALAPGALSISKKGSADAGTVIVTLRYTQRVDFYGVTQFDIVTDKKIERPLYENIR